MAKQLSVTALRENLYRVLDEILESGEPVEIRRKGQWLRITPVVAEDRLARLRPHPGTICGDPEELVHIDWSSECNPDFT